MNGETPAIHGFPVRLIVPGWDGTSWVKWVTRLTPAAQISGGFFMNPAYRYPKYALPPGTPARPAELEVIEGMPVKSSITAPEDQSKLAAGAVIDSRHSPGPAKKPSSAWKSPPMAAAAGAKPSCPSPN